jgi:hypothetical protein
MVAPLVGLAVGAAARAVAKKVASNTAKKAVAKKVVKETTKPKSSSTNKVDKKLNQLDRRSKAVAPKKKYSDMTPAEKRKFDSLNAETVKRLTSKENLRKTKPMENVPKGVSSRFDSTLSKLAAESAKKKK